MATSFADALGRTFSKFFRRKPRQSRSHAAVEAILDALDERLGHGESLDDIRIEALSDRAGVAMGSIYEYFFGKDSLLGALVGRATQRNFEELAAKLERADSRSLDEHVQEFAKVVVQTYFSRPARMRAMVVGIGRLGLMQVVTDERDRFADVLAQTARRYLPGADDAELKRTMHIGSDATMGLLVSESMRSPRAPYEQVVAEVAALARGVIRSRHPEA